MTVTKERRVLKYRIISGNSLGDLETRVNYFLANPAHTSYAVHGDIQMYSYSEYVQTLVGSDTAND